MYMCSTLLAQSPLKVQADIAYMRRGRHLVWNAAFQLAEKRKCPDHSGAKCRAEYACRMARSPSRLSMARVYHFFSVLHESRHMRSKMLLQP